MTSGDDALAIAAETVEMIVERESATLGDLRAVLGNLRESVEPLSWSPAWPDAFEPLRTYADLRLSISLQWPELGFYDEDTHHPGITEFTEDIGDGIDDLADLVDDLRGALVLAETDVQGANSWLSFHACSHWGDHVDHLIQHLDMLLSVQP